MTTNASPRRRRDAAAFRAGRRRFLRGLGVCLALPALESRVAQPLHAAESLATTPDGAPLRMAFVYFPNGAEQNAWFPSGEGKDFQFNRTMEPLAPLKDHLQVIAGLDHLNATAGPDGAGDHARANATFLTGARARKTASANIFVGESIDQLAAKRIGHLSRFASLELSCDAVRKSGSCDSGYSCAYQYNLSWRTPTSPMAPEPNPRLLFQRLFGGAAPAGRVASDPAAQRSVLDFILEDAHSLQRQLSVHDQRKLEEYLTGVREVEQRIQRAEEFPEVPRPDLQAPEGIPEDYGDYLQVMFDLLALAFQTDSTRVATLMLAGDGSNRAFPQIGIPEGHHYLTHQQHEEDKREKVAKIDRFYMEHFAAFLEKLNQTQDADGQSILHNSMIVYGSGIADGNRHTHDNLPIILAGAGGGTLQTGRFVKHRAQPTSNLFLSMLDRLGIEDVDQFGDSTGRLEDV